MASNGRKKGRRVKGEPWVWLSGGAVATGVVMIVAMLVLIFVEGTTAFWPHDVQAYVLGESRYRLRHPQHGPVWISRDDTLVVIPGAGAAWRELDGAVPRAAESPRRATILDFMNHPELFEGQRHWRLRDRNGRLLRDNAGNELTPEAFAAEPERHRPVLERGSGDFFDRIILDDREHGEVWIPQSNDALLVEVEWRALDGTPVALEFESPRPAAIADLRALPQLLQGVDWLLEDSAGQVLQDADGRPISARSYLADAAAHPSPWGYYDEDGRKVGLDTLLGEDHWRDHRVLVGAPRGERAMDVRALPPNPDGSPVKPFQLEVEPREILVRQGNQGSSLYGESAYFRWVRLDLPDNEAMKRHAPSTYNETVLTKATLPFVAVIERREKGVLTGYVSQVTIDGEAIADLERDGREATWEAFVREQERMREHYLRRYKLEKKDIGRVNWELKELSDDVKRIRYEHRDSHLVEEMIEQLNEAYAAWEAQDPLPKPELEPEESARLIKEWHETLPDIFGEWDKAVDSLEASERERQALASARETLIERARIQAFDFCRLRFESAQMSHAEENATYVFTTSDGRVATLLLSEIVRAFRPNELGLTGKLGVYADRVWEYLSDDPRESNTEGGIWPVILGTLIMTLLMCVAVVPFGVIAALYLREYAKQGALVSTVRISVNNLAGVPSIVFGIFGLGFFCIMVGGTIDDLFFPELKPAPTFGGGGILWAALTLALLTVPVVIVSTEEALSAVPSSQREASLACGASKFQTIWRVILPQALPGVLTGTILAMARGAGEVAPLMLVGAVKYAPFPPADSIPPFVHLERKFMHLGFHVYDVGFQSPNVDNTKPLVFATALILIALVALLNVFAIAFRNRLRKRLATSHV